MKYWWTYEERCVIIVIADDISEKGHIRIGYHDRVVAERWHTYQISINFHTEPIKFNEFFVDIIGFIRFIRLVLQNIRRRYKWKMGCK